LTVLRAVAKRTLQNVMLPNVTFRGSLASGAFEVTIKFSVAFTNSRATACVDFATQHLLITVPLTHVDLKQ
jgi:hypothetical protein